MWSKESFFSCRAICASAVAFSMTLAFSMPSHAQRQMENLGRGVVALQQESGVYVGWRMLATEPDSVAFNVYRASGSAKAVKLNAAPLRDATSFVDTTAPVDKENVYSVRLVGSDGREEKQSAAGAAGSAFTIPANAPVRNYLSIPLQTPTGYTPGDASVGDLDGDGEYEIVVKQEEHPRDNSQSGVTGSPKLEAYTLQGKFLWRIDLGRNIREGAHYTQFMVYDLDGDGKAEIACKTADGTVDGTGKVIGDAKADYRNEAGRILRGPEYLTIFEGKTGKALVTVPYVPSRHPTKQDPTGPELKAVWGDDYGNRVDRFLACVAYLDGVHPSLVMCRGYYTRTVLAAWDFKDGKLTPRWVFDSATPGNEKFGGQGNHNLSVADVDGDNKDEIIYGAMAIDDNGKGLYSTGFGHGDALHVSDLDPTHPGLEVFDIQERFDDAGVHMTDAKTGAVLWKKASLVAATSGGDKGEGPGRGLALDIDPRTPGAECWAAGAGLGSMLWDCKGNLIGNKTPTCNMGIYWDGDLLSEILSGTTIQKWDYLNAKSDTILNAADFDCAPNNGTKANPSLSADIFGDWREEIIYRTRDNRELRIFTTTIPTKYRFYTLMHDPVYRLGIAWQNVAYNQPPHLGFYLGDGMMPPPRPNITLAPHAKQ